MLDPNITTAQRRTLARILAKGLEFDHPPFYSCPAGLEALSTERDNRNYCKGSMMKVADEESLRGICSSCSCYYRNGRR